MGKLTSVDGKMKLSKASDGGMKQNTLDSFFRGPLLSYRRDLRSQDPVNSISVLSNSSLQREDIVKSLLRDVFNAEGAKRLLLELMASASDSTEFAARGLIDTRNRLLSETTTQCSLSNSTTFNDLDSSVSQIKTKRRKYSANDQSKLLKLAAMFRRLKEAVRAINKIAGYETVNYRYHDNEVEEEPYQEQGGEEEDSGKTSRCTV